MDRLVSDDGLMIETKEKNQEEHAAATMLRLKAYMESLEKLEKAKEKKLGIYGWNQQMQEDSLELINDTPYDPESVRIDHKILSVYQVCRWIEEGELNLRPEYQRNEVWSLQQKSLLIESLILNIPIPSFYMDQNVGEQKTVIDGLQRLSAIYDFMKGKYRLSGLQYLTKSCEGKKFMELDRRYRRRIEDTQLSINILDQSCPEMVKFDVFRRVNTGGIPLNAQEIRNAMASHETRTMLKDMFHSKEFQKVTGGKINDLRMDGQALCLQFLTLYAAYDETAKYPIISESNTKMMDEMLLKLNRMNQKQRTEYSQRFRECMKTCYAFFGESMCTDEEEDGVNANLLISLGIESGRGEWCGEPGEKYRETARKILRETLDDPKYKAAVNAKVCTQETVKECFFMVQEVRKKIYDQVNQAGKF